MNKQIPIAPVPDPKRMLHGYAANVYKIGEPALMTGSNGLDIAVTVNFACKVADDIDGEMAHACIEAARQEGVHYLALLDKQFVLDALREKAERMADHAK